MGIEIAYRIKKGFDVWDTFTRIKAIGMQVVRNELAELYELWASDETMLNTMVEELSTPAVPSMTPEVVNLLCSLWAQKEYLKALDMKTRHMNLSVYVVVRKLGGRYYLTPHCSGVLSKALDFMEHDRRLEDFSYWHSEKTPPNISKQAWVGRRKVWERLLNDEGGFSSKAKERLTIEICSPEGFDDVDPFMIKEVEL